MILELVDKNDPILYNKTEDIDFENPQIDPEQLFNDLKETLIHNGGVGLAANQVGIPYSCFVMGDTKDPDGILGIFNPQIVSSSDETNYMNEGCLTFPGLFLKIKRPEEIRFRAANFEGEVDSNTFRGLSARIFQHEKDHLDGVVFTKRVNVYYLEKAKKQRARNYKSEHLR